MSAGASGTRSSRCASVSSVMVVSSVKAAQSGARVSLRLQVAINEVDLLLSAKSLADVLRPDLADAVDGLQLAIRGGEQLLPPSELGHDPLHNEPGQTRDAAQNAKASRGDRVIQRVELAVEAEQLGQPTEVQQVLV